MIDKERNNSFENVDMDLWGPNDTRSVNHHRFALLIVERKSRIKRIFPLVGKTGIAEKLRDFEIEELYPHGHALRSVHSDKSREFSGEVKLLCREKGVPLTTSAPDGPQENGLSEQAWRTIEWTRCMMHDANAPKSMWSVCMETAACIENRLPTKALNNQSPFEAMAEKVLV